MRAYQEDNNKIKYRLMEQITIATILQKIRAIAQECGFEPLPQLVLQSPIPTHLQQYLSSLERMQHEILNSRDLEEQYGKLELLLQKQETDIRKRIGIQQQLKLYTDTLKSQVQELEAEKIDLLQNSKAYIKQLKKTNEELYVQLHPHLKPKSREKSKSASPLKTEFSRHNKSASHCKSKNDRSIKEIVKTEYIDRDRSHSGHKNKQIKKQKGVGYSTISGYQNEYNQNAKTFQVLGARSSQKEKGMTSKKNNKHVFSNFTLLNFLDSGNKKMKGTTKSPGKCNKKKEGGRVNGKELMRQKKVNKSIFSVTLGDPSQSKKETI